MRLRIEQPPRRRGGRVGTTDAHPGVVARRCAPHEAPRDHVNAWYAKSGPSLGISFFDWYRPAVDDVLNALLTDSDLEGPLARLGVARADAGLTLEELLTDIDGLLELLAPRDRRRLDHLALAVAPTAGWSEAFTERLTTTSCVDPMSGLVNGEFLEVRARQLQQQCASLGVDVSQAFGLVVVHFYDREVSPLSRMHHSVAIAKLLRDTFRQGETLATVAPWCHAVIVSRDAELADRLATVMAGFETTDALVDAEPHLWVEPLPDEIDSLPLLLDDLSHRHRTDA